MTIDFTPKHIDELPLRDLNPPEFLVIALEAAHRVGWSVSYISNVGFIAFTNNPEDSWNGEIRLKIRHRYAQLESASIGEHKLDLNKNKENLNRFTAKFQELKPQYNQDQLEMQYEFLTPYIYTGHDDVLKLPPPPQKSHGFFSFFVPVEGYFVTPVLANLNLLLFFIMVATGVNIMEPDTQSLLKWGANYRSLTLNGEPWRLITAVFLHIGILHVLANMYALLSIGYLLEPYLGKRRLLTVYLLTGLVASLTSLWWHHAGVSAGASGAIFGMYGVFLAMLTTDLIDKKARQPLLVSIVVFVAYNLLNGLKDGVDNAAHLGGLISGFAIGYAYLPSLKNPDSKALKFITLLSVTVVVLVGSLVAYYLLANS